MRTSRTNEVTQSLRKKEANSPLGNESAMSLQRVSNAFKYQKIWNLPKDSHSRTHQTFATLAICRDKVNKLEDRLNVGLKSSDLRGTLVG